MKSAQLAFELERVIKTALAEDIGTGDITTSATIPAGTYAAGRYIAKDAGVLCGAEIPGRVYAALASEAYGYGTDSNGIQTGSLFEYKSCFSDGDRIKPGDIIAEVRGEAALLLTGERVGLNLMQRLSGIATRTAEAAAAVEGTGARITDTRKTTPGLRLLEKYAVRVGGGSNHRFNLSDGILIKDNHIAAAGSITAAVPAARDGAPHTLKIEVEVESLEQLREALDAGADIIMLDNMSSERMAEAVRINAGRGAGRAVLEASGNMDRRDLREVAATGVDLISIGALTHTVRALDISLKFALE